MGLQKSHTRVHMYTQSIYVHDNVIHSFIAIRIFTILLLFKIIVFFIEAVGLGQVSDIILLITVWPECLI